MQNSKLMGFAWEYLFALYFFIFAHVTPPSRKARIGVSNNVFSLEIPVKIDKRFCGMTFYFYFLL